MDTKDDAHRQRAGEVWRCEDCGDMADPLSSKWRWSGECWQHHHGLAGHINAKCFGEDPATVRAPRVADRVMLQDGMAAYDRETGTQECGRHQCPTCDTDALQAAYKAMLSAAEAER